MASSAPNSPAKTPTKTKKAAARPNTGSASKKRPEFSDMVISAVSELTRGNAKGATRQAVVNYIKNEYEFGVLTAKRINNSTRMAMKKLMDNGQLVPSKGTNFIDYHFKLEENLRSRVRAAAKKEAKKDVASPVRMRAQSPSKPAAKKAKASPKKKTPAKKQTKKTTTTPKKPAVKKSQKKATSKAQTPKKTKSTKA